ncbi:N-acetylglucosamine/diacetylchitobiose ABC transporter substrate-binding protein [Actinocorallia lasiicapitis]
MSQETSGLGRRDVLKRIGLTAVVVGPGASILSACATSGDDGKGTTDTSANTSDPKNPFGVEKGKALDVVIFNGGYKDQYAKLGHEPVYATAWEAKVNHTSVVDLTTYRARFSSGTQLPDVVDNSGTGAMDFGSLASSGAMVDLTEFWDSPSYDDPSKKIKDTVLPGTVEVGLVNGKPYQMNYVATTFGLWYNKKLFADNGWEVPKTGDEFKALCEKIQAKGIVPFAYAGKNAAYYQYAVFVQSIAKLAGNQAVIDLDNLKEGAWSTEAVKKVVTFWNEITTKYSKPEYEGMIHTQVQTLHKQNKIAFYPSGDWLENEMKATNGAAGFEYAIAPLPDLGGEQLAFPALRINAGEPFFVAAKSANPKGGLEYLRIMLSKQGAKDFYKNAGSLTVVQDALEGVTLSPGGQSVADATKAAGSNLITTFQFQGWYGDFDLALRTLTNKVSYGGGSVDDFVAGAQKAADKTAKDPKVKKQTRTV